MHNRILLKCDLEGVPFIVQKFDKYHNTYSGNDMLDIKLYTGKHIRMSEDSISFMYPLKIWKTMSRLEMYEVLENFFNDNLGYVVEQP